MKEPVEVWHCPRCLTKVWLYTPAHGLPLCPTCRPKVLMGREGDCGNPPPAA